MHFETCICTLFFLSKLQVLSLNYTEHLFFIHYLTSIDIHKILVILKENIQTKIDGMVYIKNNITEYL